MTDLTSTLVRDMSLEMKNDYAVQQQPCPAPCAR